MESILQFPTSLHVTCDDDDDDDDDDNYVCDDDDHNYLCDDDDHHHHVPDIRSFRGCHNYSAFFT